MRKLNFKKLTASVLSLATALTLLPAIPAQAYDRDCVFVTRESDGRQIWFEQDVQMGVYGAPGNVWYDGTERGKEIYDRASDAWYWLDTVLEGAKATGKEVFMPYVYGNESDMSASAKWDLGYESNDAEENLEHAKLGYQIANAMLNGEGKWVRYDENGKMLKGWVTIEGALADIYTDQVGNKYYYDRRTGVMAKGVVEIDGKHYFFDRITGVCQGETQDPTDEEVYIESLNASHGSYLTLATVETKRVYENRRYDSQRDTRTVYTFGDEKHPTSYTKAETFTMYDGQELKTSETEYKVVEYTEGNSTWTSQVQTKSTNWSYDSSSKTTYKSRESTYEYAANSERRSKAVSFGYRPDGSKSSVDTTEYTYDANGNETKEIEEYISYNSDGTVNYTYKDKREYVYENGNIKEEIVTNLPTQEGGKEYLSYKYVYTYDANGKRIKSENYSGTEEGQLVLNSVTEYREEATADGGRKEIQENYRVTDGTKTDIVTGKHIYFYDKDGSQTRSESYYLYDDELLMSSYSIYEKVENENGYIRYYTYYNIDHSTEPPTEYVSDKTVDEYEKRGNRTVNTKETWYSDTDGDRTVEVDYYTLYDTEFTYSTEGMTEGQTKTRTNVTYNADGKVYYTYTTTYKAVTYNY